jgi:hypothetical protein
VFLLSPAHCGGRRAQLLLSGQGRFPLAERLRLGDPVTLGEAFSFLSGLYFRGKLAYATRYALPPAGVPGVQVITTNQGLLSAGTGITLGQLRNFGSVEIAPSELLYRRPLERDLRRMGDVDGVDFVLLGSVATDKYADILLGTLGERLLYPVDFVGRGDMSRGALLLRAAETGAELEYRPLLGATRRGPRAPRIGPGGQASARAGRDRRPRK